MADENRERAPARARHALLSGGGSGGHVFPALAIGAELRRRGWRVSFAGGASGMEARLVDRDAMEFLALPARPLVGRGPLARLAALATLARSARIARRWIRDHDVDAVVATGGYASAPAGLGASWARRPLLLVEPNARPGAANRWLSGRAAAAAVADAAAGRELRCPSFVAGVPVRPELFEVRPLEASDAPRLLVLGGSQGSRRLNQLVAAAAAGLLDRIPELTVLHQCGERWVEETQKLWRDACGEVGTRVEVVGFVTDVPAALGSASLVVSRAGAITLAELCAAGRPAILLPLVLAGGHQRANAERLELSGAADVLDPETADSGELGRLLEHRLADREGLVEAGRRARSLAVPGSAAAIAERLEQLVGGTGS